MMAHDENVFRQIVEFIDKYITCNRWYEEYLADGPEGPVHQFVYCPDNFRFHFIFVEIVNSMKYYRFTATLPFTVDMAGNEKQRTEDFVTEINRHPLPGKLLISHDGQLIYDRRVDLPVRSTDLTLEEEVLLAISLIERMASVIIDVIKSDRPIKDLINLMFANALSAVGF